MARLRAFPFYVDLASPGDLGLKIFLIVDLLIVARSISPFFLCEPCVPRLFRLSFLSHVSVAPLFGKDLAPPGYLGFRLF